MSQRLIGVLWGWGGCCGLEEAGGVCELCWVGAKCDEVVWARLV